jgi:hypothetical protein
MLPLPPASCRNRYAPKPANEPTVGHHDRHDDQDARADDPLPPAGGALDRSEVAGRASHLEAGLRQGEDDQEQQNRSDGESGAAPVVAELEPLVMMGFQEADQNAARHGDRKVLQLTHRRGGDRGHQHLVVEVRRVQRDLGGDQDACERGERRAEGPGEA